MPFNPYHLQSEEEQDFWAEATLPEHSWEKACLVSGFDTPYRCSRCGCEAVRYGLDWPPRHKGKYKAAKWQQCTRVNA